VETFIQEDHCDLETQAFESGSFCHLLYKKVDCFCKVLKSEYNKRVAFLFCILTKGL